MKRIIEFLESMALFAALIFLFWIFRDEFEEDRLPMRIREDQ